ncbi:MAG: FecR family protein [Steroidobacteraceae bacterium]
MNDKDIERVLKAAGPREQPDAGFERAMRERLRDEWRAVVANESRRRQRRVAFALAASVLAAAIGTWMVAPPFGGSTETAATLALASGEVRARQGRFARWRATATGQALMTGTTLETGPAGRSALSLRDGISVRLDHDTRLALTAPDEITLERGALYVDAGRGDAAAEDLVVVTSAGAVRHVGTQYEARLVGSKLRLRVREGRVEWQSKSGRREHGVTGEQLTIADDGEVQRAAATPYGESWDWVAGTSPGIAIEGLQLRDFLSWAARELGCEVAYVTPEIASEAAGVVLHGSIAGLTPRQALDAVLATTRVRAIVLDGRILVSSQEARAPPAG